MSLFEQLPRDYRDMLRLFVEEQVEFLIVGGWETAYVERLRKATGAKP